MPAKLMDYIIKIIDYVAEHPDSSFELWNDSGSGTDDSRYPRLFGNFAFYDKISNCQYIGRNDDVYWSMQFDVNKDNLKYLVEKLEEKEKLNHDS